MKNLIRVLFAVLSIQSSSVAQLPIIQSIIDQTNIDSLLYFVKELSGEVSTTINGSPYTIVSRYKNNASNDKAADYIKQKLNSYGLVTYDQWWSGTGRNVYGVQPGVLYPNKKYIICAHYDDMPSGSIAPGADDNASGTAAVLEAARILTQYLANYTIIYALWDEEEQGLVGSAYYAQQAALAGDSIMGVINMDMIAWDSDNDNVGEIHVRNYANSVSLKDQMVGVNTLYNIGVNTVTENPGTTASDQASFWNNGYGAILLIEEYYGNDFNAYYHTVNDRYIHFNLPYYHKMSRLSLATTAVLAELSEIVPVELLTFTASIQNSEVHLIWSTATELNNIGFEVERSYSDQNNFAAIGFVNGKGSSTEIVYYSFIDKPVLNTDSKLFYRLKQIDLDGTFSYSDIISVIFDVPGGFALNQNYPNPFNPSTIISYQLKTDVFVSLKVYDFIGREISTLINEIKPAGKHEVIFDAKDLPSGTYFYTLIAGDFISTKKMMLIK